ncbi:tyrosine-type recombinase/integrase [Mucilaginibacter sp. X4EP1]|uniref:tyrosine-type recombinase/integrase n=1 Tax=Mucilaginibacter sp. X4EP1 TaxID=2723092 RepID=UPI002169D2C0|nr:site-specific integrase [Mucilaginibacter sp. X4EP1]MCS3814379.1 integrase [Mucilaginibacter sp. X4EP1]
MEATRKFTTPVIKKGKEITFIPKGSSKLAQTALNVWYVEYYYNGKQVRVKGGLNYHNDDHLKKQYEADVLLQSIKDDLANGYDPNNPAAFIEKEKKELITLDEAIKIFKDYHVTHQSRSKTVSTYLSKLTALSKHYPGALLKDINTRMLETFVQSKVDDGTYAHNSVKSAKRIIGTFFNVMVKKGYSTVNPKEGFDKKIKSTKELEEKHTPYTDADVKRIFEYLDANDKYAAFFCRMIYYTCVRPGEIRGLQVKDVNLKNNTITIRASVKKNPVDNKNQIIEIDRNFIKELEKLNLSQFPQEYYLTGSTMDIVGKKQVGINTPYQKLMTALNNIDKQDVIDNPHIKTSERITNKGYDLYSFKHTSNIKKYNAGWTLSQIMKANRHGSISMTEIYLKKLGTFTDTKHLEVPAI